MDFSDSLDIAKQSGTRGGLEQFSWDSLRSIPRKEREHYLGYSLHQSRSRGRGRSNRNDWHSKIYKSASVQRNSSEFQTELDRVISKEQEIMNRLLGTQEDAYFREQVDRQSLGSSKDLDYIVSAQTGELHPNDRTRVGIGRMINVNSREIYKDRRKTKKRSFSRSLSI